MYSPSSLICTFLQIWPHLIIFLLTKQSSLHFGRILSPLSFTSWSLAMLVTAWVIAGWTGSASVTVFLERNCASANLQSGSPYLDPVKKMERGPRHKHQIACVPLSSPSSIILHYRDSCQQQMDS